jgi:hypothetical protein
MIIVTAITIWFLVAFFMRWVVEPYVRLKRNLFHDEVDKIFLTFFWPFGIPIYFLYGAVSYCLYRLSDLDDKIDDFWWAKIRKENDIRKDTGISHF